MMASCPGNHLLPALLVLYINLAVAIAHGRANPSRTSEPQEAGLPVDALFVFGDSLWDVGNNKFSANPNIIKPAFYPYSLDYLPGSGRCSNGRLAVDFLGEWHDCFQPTRS